MATYMEFAKKRKRNRVKKMIKRTTVYMIVGVFFVVVLFAWMIAVRLNLVGEIENELASYQPGSGYPVIPEDMGVQYMVQMGTDIALVTDGGNYMYNTNGAKMFVDLNNYSHPVTVGSSKRLLVYDHGGKQYKITSKIDVIIDSVTEERILCADIAENNNYLLATESNGGLAEVAFYNPVGDMLYRWETLKGYIYSVLAFDDSEGFVAISMNSEDGRLFSTLHFHIFGEEMHNSEVNIGDEIVLSIAQNTEGNIQIITDKSLRVYTKKGDEIATTQLGVDITDFENSHEGQMIVAYGDYRENEGVTVDIYTSKLEKTGSTVLHENVLELSYSNNRLLILTDHELYLADKTLSEVKPRDVQDLTNVELIGSYYYGLTTQGLDRKSL